MTEESFVDAKTPPPDHGNRGDVRTLNQLAKDLADEQHADLAALLAMPEGRRFLWRVLDASGIASEIFSESHASMAWMDGQRRVGITIVRWLAAIDPLAYPRLMAEGGKDRATAESIRLARLAEARRDAEKKGDRER